MVTLRVHEPVRPPLGGALAYVLVSMPFAFVTLGLVFATAVTLLFSIVWAGIPLLMAVTTGWRAMARAERRWLRATLGVDIDEPYRSLPPGSVFRRWRAKLRDPATWRDVAYLLCQFPVALVAWLLVVPLWSLAVALVALPVWAPLLRDGYAVTLPNLHADLEQIHTVAQAVACSAVGVVLLLVAAWVTPWIAATQAWVARALLAP